MNKQQEKDYSYNEAAFFLISEIRKSCFYKYEYILLFLIFSSALWFLKSIYIPYTSIIILVIQLSLFVILVYFYSYESIRTQRLNELLDYCNFYENELSHKKANLYDEFNKIKNKSNNEKDNILLEYILHIINNKKLDNDDLLLKILLELLKSRK